MKSSPLRRFAVAFVALAFSAILFHTHVANALVTRGDDLFRAGDIDGALAIYERGLHLDPSSAVAADRFAFLLLLRRRPGDAVHARAIASAALHHHASDPALLTDRGFAAARLARWREAERDFTAAALAAHDPRYAHLAARMALRNGERERGRADLRTALALDRTYQPARVLLARFAR